VTLDGKNAVLSFPTQTGATYQLQSKNSLTAEWVNRGSAVPGTGGVVTSSQPTTGDQEYFRVVVR
jgi:hypothetical protein